MITYKKGCILTALENGEIDIFGHGCNCSNGFGSGIAKQIAKKYPMVKDAFHKDNSQGSLGCVDFVNVGDDKYIANCYTQKSYGRSRKRYINYEAIYESLETLASHCEFQDLKAGLPRIGAGLGGGSWTIIEAIIEECFKDIDVIIYDYE